MQLIILYPRRPSGFTLMEVLIVVVLLGIIMSFAIANYSKSIRHTNERNIVTQLKGIYAANRIYKAQANKYYNATNADLASINTAFDLNIISNGATYVYNGTDSTYSIIASSGSDFAVKITQAALSTTNPCCDLATINTACPSLPSC